jgi:hypothetical protein
MANAINTTSDTMTTRQSVRKPTYLSNHVGKRIYGVIKQWNQTCADYADMGTNVLKLLANPDTNQEQVLKAWAMYQSASERINTMRDALATRYPDYDFKI